MPNRIIKESICTSDDIEKLSPDEEVFFYRLIVICDDFGRFDARPSILKGRMYPLKNKMKESDINRYLMKLSEIGLIQLYSHEEKEYLYLTKWEYHQQRRAKHSKFPEPSLDINCNQMKSDDSICPRETRIEKRESRIENREYKNEKRETEFTELQKTINDFIAFRKKKKNPMTDRAIELMIKELEKLASDDETKIKILEQSIVSGWNGIFPLKDKGGQNGGTRQDTTEDKKPMYDTSGLEYKGTPDFDSDAPLGF